MLVIAAEQDRIAPPEDTVDLLAAEFPDAITAVRIGAAGHALLPEQPEQISAATLRWLEQQTGAEAGAPN